MDEDSAFRTALTVLLALALIFNALFLIFSFRRRVATRLCTLMLRSQTSIDSLLMVANLVNIQYFELLPLPPQSLPDPLWLAYCKLISSELLHWSLVSMSVYNLVCVAIERCCCLCAPFWYRRHKLLLLRLFAITVLASPLLVEAPFCWIDNSFEKQREGNSSDEDETKRCTLGSEDEQVKKAFGIAYVMLFWILPSLLSVLLYLAIIRTIRQSSTVAGTGEAAVKKISSATRRLTLMTGVTSIAFVLLFALDSVNYLLYCLDIVMVENSDGTYDSIVEHLDSFLLNLNSAVNPLLYLIFLPDFRRFVACAGLRGGWQADPASGTTTQ